MSAQKTPIKKTGRARGLFKGLNKGLGIRESIANRSFTKFLVSVPSLDWYLFHH
jgi:hypothetical protein